MRLYGYSTKAQDVCQWPSFKRDALVYGVEVEMEPRGHSGQRTVLEKLGDDETLCFCKSDGSLDAGVELVTVPLSLNEHRTVFDWRGRMRPVLPYAMSGSRTSNCGMHVHVNRRAISNLTLGKMLMFMNDPAMVGVVATVAQRTASTWARPTPKKWKDALEFRASGSRYQTLNITGPTVEFRVFRGSLRHDRILKNLEFCESVVEFCRVTSAARVTDPALYLEWVAARRREFPALNAFLVEVGAV
jgi:hypothetical protein